MSGRWIKTLKLAAVLVVWPYICVGSVFAWSIWPMHEGRPSGFRARATTLVITQWPRFLLLRSNTEEQP